MESCAENDTHIYMQRWYSTRCSSVPHERFELRTLQHASECRQNSQSHISTGEDPLSRVEGSHCHSVPSSLGDARVSTCSTQSHRIHFECALTGRKTNKQRRIGNGFSPNTYMTHNGAPQTCSKFLNQGRVLFQYNSSSLRHQSQSTQAPSSHFLLEGGFVERLVLFGSPTKSASPHCNFGISRALAKWAAAHLHHDDTLQITVHRRGMQVSTQVNQLFETF
jgi:hypothetical protein